MLLSPASSASQLAISVHISFKCSPSERSPGASSSCTSVLILVNSAILKQEEDVQDSSRARQKGVVGRVKDVLTAAGMGP